MTPSPLAQALLADPRFPQLQAYLIGATGLAYYADKDRDLAARVAARLTTLGMRDCGSYLALLGDPEKGEAELDALIKDLTIGETFFFRHREIFDALRDVVFPDVLARNQGSRQLRVWSAGCSTGAEPYSVSILLRRELAARIAGWDVTIVGTDINREFLHRANEGRFEEWAFRTTPPELKQTCFVRSDRAWEIAPPFREGVSFQYHNLVTHPFPSLLNNLFAFDVILCRNVTIYFSYEIVRRIIGHFHQCLTEGGWLLVGHAEPNVELFRAFRTVNVPGAVLYQKNSGPVDIGAWTLPALPPAAPPPAAVQPWVPPTLPDWPAAAPANTTTLSAAPPPPAASELDVLRDLADRGELEKAERCCRDVLAKDKLNVSAYFYHALILEQMGRHAEAEHALRRVLYLDRNAVLAHYYLGLLLQKKGQLDQAARSFRNVLQLLTRIDSARVFADGDGITVGELQKLTQMHLEVLEGT